MARHEPKPIKTECSILANVDTTVEVNLDEVLDQFDDDDIVAAMERRARRGHREGRGTSLLLIYEEFARRGDAPEVLRDFLYMAIGRILP